MFILFMFLLVALDQVTKYWIQNNISLHHQMTLTSFLNAVHVKNYGVSFSLLTQSTDMGRVLLIGLSSLISLYFGYIMIKSRSSLEKGSYALIVSGAVGNIIDRVYYHGVIDFIDFHLYSYHWPAFNLADVYICLGVFLLLFRAFFGNEQS